jgi:hypothetical protein
MPTNEETHQAAIDLFALRLGLSQGPDPRHPLRSGGTRYQVRARTTQAGIRGRRVAVHDVKTPLLVMLFGDDLTTVERAFRITPDGLDRIVTNRDRNPTTNTGTILNGGVGVEEITSLLSSTEPTSRGTGIVLTSNPGSPYRDVTGVSYEYPQMYANRMVSGAAFVYYRSGDREGDPRYFGTGTIGDSRPSASTKGWLECDILDYRAFEAPVPFRATDGRYLEPGGSRRGYYQQGCRRVPIEVIEEIRAAAMLTGDEASVVTATAAAADKKYASSDLAKKIDQYAMEAAAAEATERYPGAMIVVMPHNNPGYDIRVERGGRVVRYIEVKGTAGDDGAFFISEGERRFSEDETDSYSLLVVREVDLDKRTHIASWHDGAVDKVAFSLKVRQWQGVIPAPSA